MSQPHFHAEEALTSYVERWYEMTPMYVDKDRLRWEKLPLSIQMAWMAYPRSKRDYFKLIQFFSWNRVEGRDLERLILPDLRDSPYRAEMLNLLSTAQLPDYDRRRYQTFGRYPVFEVRRIEENNQVWPMGKMLPPMDNYETWLLYREKQEPWYDLYRN